MNKLRTWLSGLLILQVLLVVIVYSATNMGETKFESKYLLGINKNTVNKIQVSATDSNLTLEKKEKGWVIASQNNLPADQSKVVEAIEKLYDLKTNWPVTTKKNAHERFDVADNKFGRRITLSQGEDKSQVVYIGNAPSFKKSHVRPEGDVNVYALEINAFDFPEKADGWLEKTLLSVSEVTAMSTSNLTLKKNETNWTVANDKGDFVTADSVKVDMVTEALKNLTVLGIAETVPTDAAEGRVTLKVSSASGEWTYELFKEISTYFIKRNDIDSVFKIGGADFKALADMKTKDYIKLETVSEN